MKHASSNKAYMRARYDRLSAAGTCVTCGNAPARPGRKCCPDCAEKSSTKSATRAKRLRKVNAILGVCIVCNARTAMPRMKWCAVCSEAHTTTQATLRQRRRDRGDCTRCGRPPVPGKVMCASCCTRNGRRAALSVAA